MNMREKMKLFEVIDHCQDALESYRMMLLDRKDPLFPFDEKEIKNYEKTFDAVSLTEEERMDLYTQFSEWRNQSYDENAEVFSNPTISIDEFIRDCSIQLSNLKLLVKDIDQRHCWHKLFSFLQSAEEKYPDPNVAPLITSIIEHTPPVYDRISALQKFDEISTGANNILNEKLNPFRSKANHAFGNLLSTFNTIEKIALELKDNKADLDKNQLSIWLSTYCNISDELNGSSEKPRLK